MTAKCPRRLLTQAQQIKAASERLREHQPLPRNRVAALRAAQAAGDAVYAMREWRQGDGDCERIAGLVRRARGRLASARRFEKRRIHAPRTRRPF